MERRTFVWSRYIDEPQKNGLYVAAKVKMEEEKQELAM